MAIILGIESTAHTFGIGIVKNGKIIANQRDMYTTEEGGIIPMESAKHHKKVAQEVYEKALKESEINEEDIDAIAFSQGPGLAPCLIEGMKFVKRLSKRLGSLRSQLPVSEPEQVQGSSLRKQLRDKSSESRGSKRVRNEKVNRNIPLIPIIPVNHCVAHLEIGRITGAKDPVMLYTSGANTQVIAYESGKYRVFGETLDLGVGNFIDNFARFLDLGFPGGPAIEKLAKQSKNYVELPYTVKGMDIALSGILTNLKQKIEKMNNLKSTTPPTTFPRKSSLRSKIHKTDNKKTQGSSVINSESRATLERSNYYTKADLAFSMQETVFAMLVEVAERALAHTGKKELLLGGGVACNSRLQEMCKIMCKEREAKFFVPERSLLVDNASMIAFLGEIMFNSGIKETDLRKIDIKPRQRTDDIDVKWKD